MIAPSTTPAMAAGAAEDDHRVDRDQQREGEGAAGRRRVQGREDRPGQRPPLAAPNEKAMSLSQLTGMPITSAASGSSRIDRQARPVRDVFERGAGATKTTTKMASAT